MKKRMLFALVVLLAMAGMALPAQAQGGATWLVEFFDNPYFVGDAVRTETQGSIAYNWGTGSPGPEVPADNFTARLSTDAFFPAGTYRFYILADDGVTLYVDFQWQLSTFDNPRPGELLTVDVTVPTGVFHVQIDYKENDGGAYVFVDWQNLATNPGGPAFDAVLPQPVSGPWTGEYYANPTLSGAPAAVVSDAGPNYNWGTGAPLISLPPDNFSVRWTRTQNFNGGPYTLTVRSDDGVRVFVDGVNYINQWTQAQFGPFTATLNLAPGLHTIVVEFYEAFGSAFIEYNLTPGTVAPPTPPPAPSAATLSIATGRLNVRSIPTTLGSTIVTRVNFGETYPIVGRNPESSWWQITANGITGWVSGAFVNTTNTALVPVTYGTSDQPATAYTLTTTANLRVRAQPTTDSERLTVIPRGFSVPIIGRNAATSWYYVEYNGVRGWVSATYIALGAGTDLNQVPVIAG